MLMKPEAWNGNNGMKHEVQKERVVEKWHCVIAVVVTSCK